MNRLEKKPSILIVDDTPENINILLDILKEEYTVLVANNGARALKIAARAPYPDLILLDIMMPDMDGYEVCRRIKQNENLKDTPVIFISAMTELKDKIQAFDCGGVDYISKPLYLQEVQARVSAHLRLRALQLELSRQNSNLKKANEDLEQKVEERTSELSKAYESLKEEITEKEKIQERIKHLAYHDHLTGLPNRLLFTDHLDHAINLASRSRNTFAVMFIDLDAFKMVNDTMGHVLGDQLLKEVSERLKQIMRKSDIIARIGGDEFMVLVENLEDLDGIHIIAHKILRSFDIPFDIHDQAFYLTASIGIALYPGDGQSPDEIIKNADIAMYKAKENGKNQYTFCSPAMKDAIKVNMYLTNKLYRALEQNELELYYQPQISCNSDQIVGVEALLRWHHPELGMISPATFIPIAEQTGLINPIGEWVLRSACRQNKLWQDAGFVFRMAVNLSLKQFQNLNLVKKVAEILQETGLDPRYLELEVTESIAMKGTADFIDILNQFHNMGISIAIDDFGTEYSSLNYLKHLPVDRIKIAMPFVHGIETNQKDAAITQTIIVLAKNLGLQVIAEGVENQTQLTFLNQRSCDEVQGFYYYKPMPAQAMDTVLKNSAVR